VVLNYPWSKDQDVWSDFGSFLGGTISPILSFITIFLLIQSLNHQNLANEKLTEQLESNIENENLRTLRIYFLI
jgi:large-conductance mechanosensitive channel